MFCAGQVAFPVGADGCRAGHGSSIACVAGLRRGFRRIGQFSMFFIGFSSGDLFELRIVRRGAGWTFGRSADAAAGQNLRVSLKRPFGRGLSRNEVFFLLDSWVVPERFG